MKTSRSTRLTKLLAAMGVLLALVIVLQPSLIKPVEAAKPQATANVNILDQLNSCGTLRIGIGWINVPKARSYEVDVTKVGQNTFTYISGELSRGSHKSSTPVFGIASASFTGGINDGDMFQVDEIRVKDRKGNVVLTVSNPIGGQAKTINCP